MHAHVSHETEHDAVLPGHAHGATLGDHGERLAIAVHHYDAGHVSDGASHGEVDIEPAKIAGKLLLVKLFAALLGVLGFILILLQRSVLRLPSPVWRPPGPRYFPYFKPLSHAPPSVA